jgi:hypothetical protein
MNDLDTQMKHAFLVALKQRARVQVRRKDEQGSHIVLPTGIVREVELTRVVHALEKLTNKPQGGRSSI